MTDPTPEQDAVFAALVQDGQQYDEGAYPRPDGDVVALGPGIFASLDGETISWKGENYTRQPAPAPAPAPVPVAADGTLRQAIADALQERLGQWQPDTDAEFANALADAVLPVVETHYAELQDEHREAHEIETENTARETERARVAEAAIEAVREWTRVEPVADAKFNEGYRAALADIAALLPKPLTPPAG